LKAARCRRQLYLLWRNRVEGHLRSERRLGLPIGGDRFVRQSLLHSLRNTSVSIEEKGNVQLAMLVGTELFDINGDNITPQHVAACRCGIRARAPQTMCAHGRRGWWF